MTRRHIDAITHPIRARRARRRRATHREAQTADCDRRLEKSRAALEHANGEIGSIAKWINEVEHQRKALQGQLGRIVPGGKLTKAQIRALVDALRDIVTLLAEADEDDRNELYQQLGVSLTYHTDGRVLVKALPRGLNVRVGGSDERNTEWRIGS